MSSLIASCNHIAHILLCDDCKKYNYILELKAQIERARDIGYGTHASWGCSKEFSEGWRECRKQMDIALEQSNGAS